MLTATKRIETAGYGQAADSVPGAGYVQDNVGIARILDVIEVTPAATLRCIETTGVDDFAAVAQRATAAKRLACKTQPLATQRDKATELN